MPPDAQDLSLNEIESLAQKAARGAGHAWGLADDVGRSARWLAAHGCDWAQSLLALLDDRPPLEACPFRLGCFLADSASVPGRYEFPVVARPVWLLPPLLAAVARHGWAVTVVLNGRAIAAAPDGFATASVPWGEVAALAAASVDVAVLAGRATTQAHPLRPFPGRRPVAAALIGMLDAYAARTYVAATAHSRRRGAGSLTRDDD